MLRWLALGGEQGRIMTEQFDFDEIIDRRSVPALKVHPMVVGEDGGNLFAAGVADMDFRAPPVITEAFKERMEHGIFGYETVPRELIPALIGWLRERHSWKVDPNHILRAPNVLNSLSMAVNLFTEKGDGVIIQPPVFFDFEDIIRENGRSMVSNPLILSDHGTGSTSQYEMDFSDLERCASKPNTKMMFLCNPHNPIGRVWTREELTKLGAICRQYGVLVVSDEIHGDLVLPSSDDRPAKQRYTPFASISEADACNSITCLSPAKTFNIAACCSAFTIVPDELRRTSFQAENSRLTVNKNNAFASAAMTAAYQGGGPWLEAVLEYIHDNLVLLRNRLSDIPTVSLIDPEGKFLVWLDFRKLGLAAEALNHFLRKEAGWAVTRGVSFGKEGAGFARLNIACPRVKLANALDDLVLAVQKLK